MIICKRVDKLNEVVHELQDNNFRPKIVSYMQNVPEFKK